MVNKYIVSALISAPLILGGCSNTLDGLKKDLGIGNQIQTEYTFPENLTTSQNENTKTTKSPLKKSNLEKVLSKELYYIFEGKKFSIVPESNKKGGLNYNLFEIKGVEKNGITPKYGNIVCPSYIVKVDGKSSLTFREQDGIFGTGSTSFCKRFRTHINKTL